MALVAAAVCAGCGSGGKSDGGPPPPGCTVTDAVDRPTLALVDGNCDGIVGNAASAIFVDGAGGNDANAGTKTAPRKTIQAGIAAASVLGKDVYVSKGRYAEQVALADGVSVFGGYDAANGWSRALANVTAIDAPAPVALTAASLTMPTEVQLVEVNAASAAGVEVNGDGVSSVGILVTSSNAVTIRGCTVTAGNGSAGADGAAGAPGAAGGNGGDATSTVGGAPGSSPCGAGGGAGGNGVLGATPGLPGAGGARAPGGGAGAPGGLGGAAGACTVSSSSNGGAAPAPAFAGETGAFGVDIGPGQAFGTFSAAGTYRPPAGPDGLPGLPGGGGGGGGSGGGAASGTNFFCTDCSAMASGAGGGGGGGGCGGSGGSGGRGGGGSFAVVTVASMVSIEEATLATGAGGVGGRGGSGGAPGGPGLPGAGAPGQVRSNGCATRSAGRAPPARPEARGAPAGVVPAARAVRRCASPTSAPRRRCRRCPRARSAPPVPAGPGGWGR